MGHLHEFRKGKSGVETCACGRFRFTPEYLKTHPPIMEEVRAPTKASDIPFRGGSMKAQFSIKNTRGDIFHLLDTHADPSWFDVRVVEVHRAPCGTLLSVVNHREKTFEERRSELQELFGKS